MIDLECSYCDPADIILIRPASTRGLQWMAANLRGARLVGGAAPVARQAFGAIRRRAEADNLELGAV